MMVQGAAPAGRPPVRLTRDDVFAASDAWSFNCGPGALCGSLGLRPEEVRPHLGDFEVKRYTNPTLMASALRSLGVPFRRFYQSNEPPAGGFDFPTLSLVRIQWAGPWTRPGVPMQARYRKTHWIAVWQPGVANRAPVPVCCALADCGRCVAARGSREAFDVNAVVHGRGWLPWREWTDELVPWLLRGCVPKASGQWWPTHVWEIDPADAQAAAQRWARP